MPTDSADGARLVSRREALRAGALIGSAAWVAPAVLAVSVTPAAADTASAPRQQGGGTSPGTVVLGEQFEQGGAAVGEGALPRTGSSVDAGKVAAVGAALTAAGGAVAFAARRRADSPTPRHQG